MVLPSGFTVPPLPALAVLLAGVAAAAVALARERPPLTDRTVLAFAPWMALGSAAYVCYQLDLLPAAVTPFASAPAVYGSTFVVAVAVWLGARRTDSPKRVLAGVGLLALSVPVALTARYGTMNDSFAPLWPLFALLAGFLLGAVCWVALRRFRPADARAVDGAGALVLFGHALDAATTAVGVDALGFGEQTPLSRLVMEFAAGLPTAPTLGVGWLFVLVKLAVAVAVVALLADYVREAPTEGFLLLALVAAVGLGPGAHNLLLFTVATP
ncbi:DUF63 family protein [Halarchaeum nitratireducens]|uniref:DUF63 domain-containing protein n=1 Tax=Halarchaeum nitratireducens TaxID=489913 RepID=A0A830G844_9EURY|nr:MULTISPECIES: DUF63 family protein [Halarchaeum]MBP2251427.1 putative membrane protein [Halarchaeum solikamskense]GGN07393.1 hypothetical protein GCM10009021_03140 [Halarchaeum nitratireducens]